jgi:acetyl esterase/lipase
MRRRSGPRLALLAVLALPPYAGAQGLSFDDVLKLGARKADERIKYGTAREQFGELWVPAGTGPHPVAIVIHGGCWQSEYDEGHIRPVCAALAKAGVAAWCIEYRRVGDDGGGWPGTFEDVARAADHLRQIAGPHRLDLARVVAVGHSAGGHLALWLAARASHPAANPIGGAPLPLRGVVALAPIPDLARAASEHVCGDSVPALMGGPASAQSERYAIGSPAALLPLGVPQTIVQGRADRIVPFALAESYTAAAKAKGDAATLVLLDGVGHFDLIAPVSKAWPAIEQAVQGLVK